MYLSFSVLTFPLALCLHLIYFYCLLLFNHFIYTTEHKATPGRETLFRYQSIMLSPVILRFSRPNSCLILLFFLSYLHHLPCALSQPDLRLCDALFHCGNLTAGFPFWGEARPEPCGHPSLGLRCQQKSNLTYLIISGLMYRVFQIDNSTNTLGLARQDFLGESFCSATLTGTRLTSELFEVLPDYKTIVVYYLCETQLHNSTNFACPKIGVASVNRNNENQERCGASFNITVPTKYVPEEDALNLTRLGSVLKEGFEVKLKIDARPCKKCQSSGGICAYEVATPICCKTNSSGSVINCSRMIPSKSSVDKHHKHCARRFSCGNQIALSYPFWTPEREECGHPEFMVNCTGDFAEYSISSVKFQILDYHYESGIIKLDRKDYHNNLCPQYPENAAINQDVLPFPHDTMLSILYYNCADPVVKVPPSFHIRRLHCEDDDIGGHSYFVLSASRSWDRAILEESSASCERNVSIPVSRSALRIEDGNPTLEAIKKALDDGFGLTLNSDCFGCLGSGGFCGHNVSSRAFVCYCVDGPHEHTCDNSETQKTEIAKTSHSEKAKGGLPKKAKIGIGFACGFLGATLLAVGLFCFINRRRKNLAAQNTSKDLSTETPYSSNYTMSTTPTSTTTFGSKHSLVQSISNLANGSVYFGVQVFSYEELEEATENFSRELGDGGFGTVYYGILKDGRAVAVKRLFERSLKRVEQFKNEIDILRSLKHPNLVILYGCTTRHSRELLLVYEYISNGTLADHLHGDQAQSRPICWPARLNIAIQTASALSFLHASEAVDITRHRHDINLANMAISKIQNDAVHELADLTLGFARDPSVKRMMMSVAELAFRCLQQEREVRPSMDEIVEVLKGIQKEGMRDFTEVVEIDVSGGDDVGLLSHGLPPPLSPVTEKETSSSNTTASSF
ncbi:unnamed protein product, partial [Thlaspi arvense]